MTALEQHIAVRNAERLAALGEKGYAHYVEDVLQDRAARYAAHVAAMDIPPEIAQWALAMRKLFGTSYVRCSHFVADWITALLIMRYGEEERAEFCRLADGTPTGNGWPLAFTDYDVQRAAELLKLTKFPADFTPLLPPTPPLPPETEEARKARLRDELEAALAELNDEEN